MIQIKKIKVPTMPRNKRTLGYNDEEFRYVLRQACEIANCDYTDVFQKTRKPSVVLARGLVTVSFKYLYETGVTTDYLACQFGSVKGSNLRALSYKLHSFYDIYPDYKKKIDNIIKIHLKFYEDSIVQSQKRRAYPEPGCAIP